MKLPKFPTEQSRSACVSRHLVTDDQMVSMGGGNGILPMVNPVTLVKAIGCATQCNMGTTYLRCLAKYPLGGRASVQTCLQTNADTNKMLCLNNCL